MRQLNENDVHEICLSEAADMIRNHLVKYGRVNVTQAKEKFGTVRVYCTLGFYSFHCITHPGRVWIQYPRWIYILDLSIGVRVMSVVNKVVVPYHKWLYRQAYKKAIQKLPFIKEEIVIHADYPDLLEGL